MVNFFAKVNMKNTYEIIPNSEAKQISKKSKLEFRKRYEIPYNIVNRLPRFQVSIPFSVPKFLLTDMDDNYSGELPESFISSLETIVITNFDSSFGEDGEKNSRQPQAKLMDLDVGKVVYGPGGFVIQLDIQKIIGEKRKDYFFPLLRFIQDTVHIMTAMHIKPNNSFGLNGKIWVDIPNAPRGWGASPLDFRNTIGDFIEEK